MQTFRIVVGLAFLAMFAYIGITVYMQYLAAGKQTPPLTGWARWRATASDSATMLWGKFSLFIAGITGNLDTFFNAVGLPQVTDAINKYIDPKVAAGIIAAIAAGAMLSRTRTL